METKNLSSYKVNKGLIAVFIFGTVLFVVLLVLFSMQAGVKIALKEQSADASRNPVSRGVVTAQGSCQIMVTGEVGPKYRSRVTFGGSFDATSGSGKFSIIPVTVITLNGKYTTSLNLQAPCQAIVRGSITAKAEALSQEGTTASGYSVASFNPNTSKLISLNVKLYGPPQAPQTGSGGSN